MASRALKVGPKRATVSAPDTSLVAAISAEEIACRAYQLWMEKGRPIGNDIQDWFQAENELKKQMTEPERVT